MGMQAWNIGTGAWRWDSDAIFFRLSFVQIIFFMGMEQLGYVFLVFFFHIFSNDSSPADFFLLFFLKWTVAFAYCHWPSHFLCLLRLQAAFAHRCCLSLWVPIFFMWGWKHVDRSMGRRVWGGEHGACGREHGDGRVNNFFSGSLLSNIFIKWFNFSHCHEQVVVVYLFGW